jgi:DNA-directed RNA polymerase I subunit RPA1
LLPKEKGLINLESKSKIAEKSWYDEKALQQPNWSNSSAKSKHYSTQYMNESYVLIRDGNLLCGVLDKAHYGSSSFSLVHCCYELYGGAVAGQLLTCLGRLFTTFLQIRGFTLGVEDVMIRDDLKKPMSKIVKKAKKCGYEVLAQAFNSSNPDDKEELINQYKRRHMDPDESYMKEIDLAYKGAVDSFQNGLTKLCFPNGLIKKFPFNNLQLMIQSGAKGSSVNSMQLSCLLGQQELEGRRPRLMVNGNTLPSFLPYDSSPISGGFICNSFMTGLTPQEYFFHCMAGREVMIFIIIFYLKQTQYFSKPFIKGSS